MPTHDCSKCKVADTCPLAEIAPWLNDHEDEVGEAWRSQNTPLAKACTGLVLRFPSAILCSEAMMDMVLEVFSLGYYKGRTYQDVPQVFKDA